jgi:hypothetical protein
MPDSTPADHVWLDVGHVNNLPEGTLVQKGNVAVDPTSGAVLDPQPEYPKETPTEPAPKSSKGAS